jgi:3-hydroxyacyl-[acyl-carrier-protein] dehydratase
VRAPLFNPDPAAYLPHRFPFLMLDRILELEPGVSARAEKRVTSPLAPFPPVLLVECVAQLAGIAASQQAGEGGFLASIDQAEFCAGTARAGDCLTVTARIIKIFGRLCLVEGAVECGGEKLVETRMTLGIGKI